MTHSSCARCGAPLPAFAADPKHPEWCGACASRALDGGAHDIGARDGGAPATPEGFGSTGRSTQAPWTMSPTVHGAQPPVVLVGPRPLDGLLTGVAAATLAGVGWWAASTLVDFDGWHYLAAVVGLVVGQGVLVGARQGGVVPGLIAVAIAAVTVLVSVYFIDRSLTIAALEDAGRTTDIPLWSGLSHAQDAVQRWIDLEPSRAAGWLLAPLLAAIVAGWPGRRPLLD